MPTEVKHGGAWRTLTGAEVRHGGAWRNVKTIEVKHGGAWRTVANFVPTCSLSSTSVSHSDDISIVYAGVDYKSDGIEYSNANPNSTSCTNSRGNWLDSGSPSAVWGNVQINSGTLWTNELAVYTSRIVMTTDKLIMVRDANSGAGNASANVTVRMYDASSGGNLLSSATFSLTASWYNPCPFCCFTPDTPILLASGLQMPIGRLRPDDEVLFYDPKDRKHFAKRAGDLIVRYDRTMHTVQFEDGTVLRVSDDHPLNVKDKGAASINPMYEYKGWGVPEQLLVGDLVTQPDGSHVAVSAIGPCDYEGAVFTLEDSFFYANGKLVY